MLFQNNTITSLETLTLRLSGMRLLEKYEIVCGGPEAELAYYHERSAGGKPEWELQRRAVCPAEAVLKLLNECEALRWDGFSGPHPKGVLDGTSFTLEASVNGGRRIRADGSQNFPRHFRDFRQGLGLLLDGAAPAPD